MHPRRIPADHRDVGDARRRVLCADEALAQLAFGRQPIGERITRLPVTLEVEVVRALGDLIVRQLDRGNFGDSRERRRGRAGSDPRRGSVLAAVAALSTAPSAGSGSPRSRGRIRRGRSDGRGFPAAAGGFRGGGRVRVRRRCLAALGGAGDLGVGLADVALGHYCSLLLEGTCRRASCDEGPL